MASLRNNHRKLLAADSPNSNFTDTTDEPTVQTCLYFCNTQSNNTLPDTGFCPQACLAICPSVCQYPFSNLPLPQEFPPSKPNKSHSLSPLLICMLILLATAFLLITLYVLYTKLCYNFYVPNSNSILQRRTRRRRRESAESYSLDEEHRTRMVFNPFWCIPTVGLPPTAISSIPIHKYGKEVEERDCAVCLAEFEEGDELRVLPKCNHAFHIPCIDTWLSSHTTCPLCRAPIIPPDDGDHDQDQDHDRHHKDENTSSSLTSVEGTTEDSSPAEVLSIHVISGEEEVHVENTLENPTENNPNKDQEALGEVTEGSCSQTWSIEREASNLLSRSLSCSGKIFSSRSNIRPSPNS